MKLQVLTGTGKASVTRQLQTLERRIERHRRYSPPVGEWVFSVAFYTEGVAEVESLSHQILAEHLDRGAPFGEVFRCSVQVAMDAVEAAMSQLGVFHSAKKKLQL
jgi:hypothetical protein